MPANVERETIPFDVLFVGAGPGSLAGAIHLARLVKKWNADVKAGKAEGKEIAAEIAVIEKGDTVGDHGLSGAVLNPVALAELLPDYLERGFEGKKVEMEDMYVLTRTGKVRIPEFLFALQPEMKSHGFYSISLGKMTAWLAGIAEEEGVTILPGTTGVEVLTEEDAVIGVRTGDKGLGKDGSPKENFTPGYDLQARVTIFGEGPRGTLMEDLTAKFRLRDACSPQVYSLGVKEVIQIKPPADDVGFIWHTMGYPVPAYAFGGGFVYNLGGGLITVGLVLGLDWKNPRIDLHRELQRLKSHPLVKGLIQGGETLAYGAKTIPEGGYYSVPRLHMNGALVIGDSAGFVRVKTLKGIHYAMKSGMFAAEAALEALKRDDASAEVLAQYRRLLDGSYVMQDMWTDRHFRSSFASGWMWGFPAWGVKAGVGMLRQVTGGDTTDGRFKNEPDYRAWKRAEQFAKQDPMDGIDKSVYVDKLTDVYKSGTKHREDQPSHIQILSQEVCFRDCVPVYGLAPCVNFCPASVYEHVRDDSGERIQVNFSNCVHCKTCGIVDPCDTSLGDGIQNIRWRAPNEGGPKYQGL